MLHSVLVGLDPSPDADLALRLALSWARGARARLTGLGIVDEPTIRKPEAVSLGATHFKAHRDDVLVEDARHSVAHVLGRFRDRCADAGVAGQTRVATGAPADELLREAVRHDLVVLGRETHFHFETQETPDETSRLVLRQMPRPVISVAGAPDAPGPVVIACDGGARSARALQMFALLAPPLEAEVIVVGVDADGAVAGDRVSRAVDYLDLHAIPARPHVVAGDTPVADVLLELSVRWRARMVVMGAHFVSELGAWLFESVTANMLKGARCPLFVS